MLDTITPSNAAGIARKALAGDLLDDLRRLDSQSRELHKRLSTLVAASGSTTTEIFGVGPVVAATVLGDTGDVTRFATADRFAAYAGTAPIEVSSGPHKTYRLSRRGNRQLNHAIHIAAVTQIRNRHTAGRIYYDRKIAEGKSPKMALRALKRRISDTLYNTMTADARRAASRNPGGQRGTTLTPARPAHTPNQLFG
jgi:transposase